MLSDKIVELVCGEADERSVFNGLRWAALDQFEISMGALRDVFDSILPV